MLRADGIVTVTPNYSLQVPAMLKNLYDRLAFVFHRPRLFKKASLAIVVQGVYGGKKIVKYIDELMSFWGCSTVKGAVVSGGLYPNSVLPEKTANKNRAVISDAASRLIKAVQNGREKQPSLFKLAIFRMTRSSMKHSDEALAADKAYYCDMGWFESRYYTDVRLGPIRVVLGAGIDSMIRRMIRKAKT
jgi:multimeric flavodoxin WrbA